MVEIKTIGVLTFSECLFLINLIGSLVILSTSQLFLRFRDREPLHSHDLFRRTWQIAHVVVVAGRGYGYMVFFTAANKC